MQDMTGESYAVCERSGNDHVAYLKVSIQSRDGQNKGPTMSLLVHFMCVDIRGISHACKGSIVDAGPRAALLVQYQLHVYLPC